MRKMHRVFMAIGLKRFGQGIIVIGIAGVTARVGSPHVPLCFAVHDPFRQNFARPSTLRDAKGKTVPLKRVFDAGHGAKQRQPIGCIRNGAVDVAPHTSSAKGRDARHRVLDIKFQPFQIVWIQLKRKVLGHRIFGCDPVCFAVSLVGTKVQAVFILAQVIADVDVTEDRQFVALFLGPSRDFGDFIGQEILMRHGHHWDGAPTKGLKPFTDALRVITCAVGDILTANVTFVGLNDPLVSVAFDTHGRAEPFNPRAQITCAFGHGLGQLCRVDVTIQRIPHPAC